MEVDSERETPLSWSSSLSSSSGRCLLILERLDNLPCEVGILAAEMAVRRGLDEPVAAPLEVEVDGHHPGPEIEVLLDDLEDLLVGDLAGAVGVDEHGERLGDADGVRHLHDAAAGEAAGDDALGGLPGDVGAAPVDLGRVLAGEGAAAVRAPSAVGVDDDLAAGEAGVAVGPADDEAARGVEVEDGLLVEVLVGDDRLDDVLLEVGGDLVVGDGLVVLGGDEDGVDADGDHGAGVVEVLNGDLGLAVGPEPGAGAVLADLGEAGAELGGEDVAEGHQLGGLVGGVAEHVALVAGADLLGALGEVAVHPLRDVGRLLLDVDEHLAAVGVEADVVGHEADAAAGVADDLLVVDGGLGGDLAEHHHHVGLGARLARHLAVGVLGEARVEHRVRHLVAQLVRVTLVHGLGGEEERLRRHFYLPSAC
ncbi:Os01g0323775, partial [Oryza sativa Japonica Group]